MSMSWSRLSIEFTAMACPCQVQVEGEDEALMRHALAQAVAEVRRIEAAYSRYRPDSIVSRLNAAAGQGPLRVDSETASLLSFADRLWHVSGGLFDLTSGVLRRAWNFRPTPSQPPPQPPAPSVVQALLPLVGWPRVERVPHPDGTAHVHLPVAGMELDFGGLGKEYAADRAAAVLAQHGLRHSLVNLGGDLHALGPHGVPEWAGQAWAIAIEHPRPPPVAAGKHTAHVAHTLAHLPLLQGGLATSGDYERFFEHQGQRYCHILNPRSGWPVQHWQSVSVVAPTTTAAGALSTVAMLQGPQAPEWLDAQQVRWLAVRHDGQVFSDKNRR